MVYYDVGTKQNDVLCLSFFKLFYYVHESHESIGAQVYLVLYTISHPVNRAGYTTCLRDFIEWLTFVLCSVSA